MIAIFAFEAFENFFGQAFWAELSKIKMEQITDLKRDFEDLLSRINFGSSRKIAARVNFGLGKKVFPKRIVILTFVLKSGIKESGNTCDFHCQKTHN